MDSTNVNSYTNGPAYTLTALNRWSVADKQLPAVDKIKTIHVYDFDNTLFNSPLPNAKLWKGETLGFLQSQDTFATGGWWHDARILAATGEGIEVEEPRAWEGWWNEKIVELIQLSMQQKDALAVLLTGRGETNFGELIKKMVRSKGLEFDIISLKPAVGPNKERLSSTMHFKQLFLESLMETYKDATEIRVYEDRVPHTKKFREWFQGYNRRQNGQGGTVTRGPITAEVVQVADTSTLLDPVQETACVQRIINDHNAAVSNGVAKKRLMIKKTVFYTGYLIGKSDTENLLTLVQPPSKMPDTEMKFLANNVLITPRPCDNTILDRVGGLGAKLTWQVTGTAVFENKIWAASVQPIPADSKYYTENPSPLVVLALRKGARPIDAGKIQNWQPVPMDKQFIFESEVGEKVLLRIEEEIRNETEYESLFPNKALKRKHGQDDETSNSRQPSGNFNHSSAYNSPQNQNRGGYQNSNTNQRGRGSHRGNSNNRGNRGGRGGNGGGRGRGRGGHGYRSLDDVGERSTYNNTPPAYNPAVAYEDFPPLQKQTLTPAQQVQQQFQQYNQFQQQLQARGGKGSGGGGGELPYF